MTKLTVILLPLSVVLATLARLRWRALGPLAVWGLTGLIVFVAGWPWLWPIDLPGYSAGWWGTLERLREFVGVAVQRDPVYTWYFGVQYPNQAGGAPWHYVWVFFLVTVPVGLHLLGLLAGLPRCWRLARESSIASQLLLTSIAVVLFFFTLPIHRYDGERLFLMVFPLWAIVVGVGAHMVTERLARRLPQPMALLALSALLAGQAIGHWHYAPYQLSYYNLLIGGLAGAERCGLEATYWGDTLSDELLDQVAQDAEPGARVVLLPTLFDGHAVYMTSPSMHEKQQRVVPGTQLAEAKCGWALLFHRQGYLVDELPQQVMRSGRLAAEVSRDGVWLSRLYQLPAPSLSDRQLE